LQRANLNSRVSFHFQRRGSLLNIDQVSIAHSSWVSARAIAVYCQLLTNCATSVEAESLPMPRANLNRRGNHGQFNRMLDGTNVA